MAFHGGYFNIVYEVLTGEEDEQKCSENDEGGKFGLRCDSVAQIVE